MLSIATETEAPKSCSVSDFFLFVLSEKCCVFLFWFVVLLAYFWKSWHSFATLFSVDTNAFGRQSSGFILGYPTVISLSLPPPSLSVCLSLSLSSSVFLCLSVSVPLSLSLSQSFCLTPSLSMSPSLYVSLSNSC